MSGLKAGRNKASQEDSATKKEAPHNVDGQWENPLTAAILEALQEQQDEEREAGHERGSRGYALQQNSSPEIYD